jgi:hypothetical protein
MKYNFFCYLLAILVLNACNTRYHSLKKVSAKQMNERNLEAIAKADIMHSDDIFPIIGVEQNAIQLSNRAEKYSTNQYLSFKSSANLKTQLLRKSYALVIDDTLKMQAIEDVEPPSGSYKWAWAMAILALISLPLVFIAPGLLFIPLLFALAAWLISRFGKSDSNSPSKKWLSIIELGAAILMVVLFLLLMGALIGYMMNSSI